MSQPTVILFTGHRVDSSDRAAPRFPEYAEPIARREILKVLEEQRTRGPVLGMAGAANGGDILFLEACRELGIPFEILLALPEAEFIEASVKASSGDWVERFRALASVSKPLVMANQSEEGLWARNTEWLIQSALAHSPKELILLALWDGKTGDGPGGTEDMVNSAQKQGARFIHLDTGKLFIRTATQ